MVREGLEAAVKATVREGLEAAPKASPT